MANVVGIDGQPIGDEGTDRWPLTKLLRDVADKIEAGEFKADSAIVIMQCEDGQMITMQNEGLTLATAVYLLEGAKAQIFKAVFP